MSAEISNKADFKGGFFLQDCKTGEGITNAQIADIRIEIEEPNSGAAVLSGSLSGGQVSVFDPNGYFRFYFPANQVRQLRPMRYNFGGVIDLKDGGTVQQFIETLTVRDGIVGP